MTFISMLQKKKKKNIYIYNQNSYLDLNSSCNIFKFEAYKVNSSGI